MATWEAPLVPKAFQASVPCFYTRSFISAELREIIKPLFILHPHDPPTPHDYKLLPDVSPAQMILKICGAIYIEKIGLKEGNVDRINGIHRIKTR